MADYTKEELEAAGLETSEVEALNDVPDESYLQVEAEADPAPVKAEADPAPAKAEVDPEPVKAEVDPEPVKAEVDPEPVKAEMDPEPVKAEADQEPVKAEADPEPVKAEVDEAWFTADREAASKPVEDAADAELQRLDTEIKELHDKYDEGDMERRDYDDAVAKARENRVDVKRHLDRNKDRNDSYCATLDDFFAKSENAVFQDQNLFNMLDAQVRILAQAAPQKSDAEVLKEARQYLVNMEVKGLARSAPAPKAGKPAAEAPEHVEKTLTDVPAAAPESTGDKSRFAHLEGLDGDALETKVANMSEAEMDAYLDETAP